MDMLYAFMKNNFNLKNIRENSNSEIKPVEGAWKIL